MKKLLIALVILGFFGSIRAGIDVKPMLFDTGNSDRQLLNYPTLKLDWPAMCPSDEAIPEEMTYAEWSSVLEQMDMIKRKVQLNHNGAYVAKNSKLGLDLHFGINGTSKLSDLNDRTSAFTLTLVSVGHTTRNTSLNPCSVNTIATSLNYHWSENIVENWENSAEGIKHRFLISKRPAEENLHDSLLIRMALDTHLIAEIEEESIVFKNSKEEPQLEYSQLSAFDADGVQLPTRRSIHGNYLDIAIDDSLARYPIEIIAGTVQLSYLKASNAGSGDQFGIAMALDGDTLVVGAAFEDSNSTGVNGIENNNTRGNSGAVYVFVRSNGMWSQQAYLKASNTDSNDFFGFSVDIDGDTIVVGALQEDSSASGVDGDQTNNTLGNSGAAYIFVRVGTVWSQEAYLKASNPQDLARFGASVAISGDTVVIGANTESSNATGVNGDQNNTLATSSGAAYVFVRLAGTWTQEAYLKASNTKANDRFGAKVDISGDTIVVGAASESSDSTGVNGDDTNSGAGASGAAFVFVRSGGVWSQQAYLKASNTEGGDSFGSAVAIDVNTIAIGAVGEGSDARGINGNQNNNNAIASGAVYVFVRSGFVWSQEAYIKASNTDSSDSFGVSVAVSGDTIGIGANFEDSNATGVNGDAADNSAALSGAAYIFLRTGTTWTQQNYLKASNTQADDRFGSSIAVEGDSFIVGANLEDSNATGIDMDDTNNSAINAGSVYVFGLDLSTTSKIMRHGKIFRNQVQQPMTF